MVSLFYSKRRLDTSIKLENEIVIAADMNGYWLRAKWKADKNVHSIMQREQTDTHDFLYLFN